MDISSFDDLLGMAAQQPTPQRLLLVFCKAELPEDATPQQKADFEAGEGGMLVPVASVDKFPDALGSFAELSAEATQHGLAWDILFVSTMERGEDSPERIAQVDQTLEAMVAAIREGQVAACLPFDGTGTMVALGG
ncbi:MAG: ribonucleotide reductase subunit alpha [Hylemonella sp.]|nr:ribonucleotide reductase subunit alpha [Hylemonella sp.]MDH5709268.1 ribonucleotide reductase subunit alpha [Hylemonella sp.]